MESKNNIDTTYNELRESIVRLYEILTFFEESDDFQNQIDPELTQHFYHLYVKAKRNFQAIIVLINSDELENGYVEATVLLRVMSESYFHLCYIMQTDKDQLLKEYDELNNKKLKQMLRSKNPAYVIKTSNKKEEKYFKNLRYEYARKKVEVPDHLMNMYKLADITHNKGVYHSIYEMFNTYVHFNPTTYLSYGTEHEDGSFIYNSFSRKPNLEARIIFHAVNVQMILARKLFVYFKISTAPKNVVDNFTHWNQFVENKKSLIFNNLDDYI